MNIITAKVVRLYQYQDNTGKQITRYSKEGFFREIQIFKDGILVHKSGPNHPKSIINTVFEKKLYIAIITSSAVFVIVDPVKLW